MLVLFLAFSSFYQLRIIVLQIRLISNTHPASNFDIA